jgi:hypothetical protein
MSMQRTEATLIIIRTKKCYPVEQCIMLDVTPHHMVHCRCNHMEQNLM